MERLIRQLDSFMGQARWDEAEALLCRCREEAAAGRDARRELSICNEQVGFYRQRQKEAGFEEAWARCLVLLQELEVRGVSRGTILLNGATALVSFGKAREALPLYEQALDCYRLALPAEDERFAGLYNNMASAFQSAGDYKTAEKYMRMALELLLQKPHHVDVATTWVNLAQLYALWGRDGDVLSSLDKAMERFDDPQVLWNDYYAHTCRKCAGAFAALGQPERERELLERADMVYEGT